MLLSATEDGIATSNVSNINDPENNSDGGQPKKRKKKNSVRKYDPRYLAFGYISGGWWDSNR